jgi:hypothetical protein
MSTDQERIHDGWLLHVDYSRTLTAQEKSFYFYCFHLASRKGIDATRSSWFTTRDQFNRDFQKIIMRKRKANKRVMALCGNFRIGLLTPLLISQIWGFDNSLFWKCNTFQSWCNAYACAVWCSGCTLEWLGYPYALMIGRAIMVGRVSVWRVAISQPKYLARS